MTGSTGIPTEGKREGGYSRTTIGRSSHNIRERLVANILGEKGSWGRRASGAMDERVVDSIHMNPERVGAIFIDQHNFPRIHHLNPIASVRVPADVLSGRDSTKELENGKMSRAGKFDEAEREKVVINAACGRVVVSPKENAG